MREIDYVRRAAWLPLLIPMTLAADGMDGASMRSAGAAVLTFTYAFAVCGGAAYGLFAGAALFALRSASVRAHWVFGVASPLLFAVVSTVVTAAMILALPAPGVSAPESDVGWAILMGIFSVPVSAACVAAAALLRFVFVDGPWVGARHRGAWTIARALCLMAIGAGAVGFVALSDEEHVETRTMSWRHPEDVRDEWGQPLIELRTTDEPARHWSCHSSEMLAHLRALDAPTVEVELVVTTDFGRVRGWRVSRIAGRHDRMCAPRSLASGSPGGPPSPRAPASSGTDAASMEPERVPGAGFEPALP